MHITRKQSHLPTGFTDIHHFLFTSGHDACVDLHEVIGVKTTKIPPKTSTLSLRKSYKVDEHAPVCIEMQPIGPVGFSVVIISRPGGHKWRYKQVSFQCKDSNLCQQWINAIKDALKLPGMYFNFLFLLNFLTESFNKK